MRLVSLVSLSSLLLLSACLSPRTATQVVVFVDAQPQVRAETRRLELVVRAGPRGDLTELPEVRRYDDPIAWPEDVTLVPLGGDVSRIFEIEATALDASGRVITVARLRGGFTENAARTLRLTLEDRCRGITCSEGYTCRGGACIELVDPSSDAGPDDMDGGVFDAPPTACTTDAECDDGVFCNGAEVCKDSVCRPGELVICDDGVRCTMDVCTGSGCSYLPANSACTAGAGGRCDPETGCQYTTCDVATTCAPEGCERTRCEGATCLRESACGVDETCCDSACVPAGCNDGNACTTDYCNERRAPFGCVNEPLVGACDDGNPCTMGETCGTTPGCTGGTARSCDDGNPCTADSCDPISGCRAVPVDGPYDDGDVCTVGERCSGGEIVPGTPNPCDDGVACTADSCRGGECTNTPQNTLCTATAGGTCDPMRGCQYGTCSAATCVPTDACEIASCSGSVCVRRPRCEGVDDGNPCTDTVCMSGACVDVPNSAACSDLNPCTTGDVCSGGSCRPGSPISCDDGNPCTIDSCAGGGCTSLAAADGSACSDGNACTTGDRCVAGACRSVGTNPCFDDNPCTTDACIAPGGCVNTPSDDGAPCGIYDPSTCTRDVCSGGSCDPQSTCPIGQICCPDGIGRCRTPGDPLGCSGSDF